jgi:inner membrane organizing system protein 1
MPETSIAPPSAPVTRPAKPVSEALLNEKVCSSFMQLLFSLELELQKLAMGAEEVDWANVYG